MRSGLASCVNSFFILVYTLPRRDKFGLFCLFKSESGAHTIVA